MTKRFSQIVVLAVFCLLFVSVAHTQTGTSGSLLGVVTDATGAVIAGAEVRVKDEATGNVRDTKSGGDGTFSLSNVSPGTYTITVTISGFKTSETRNVKVILGTPANVTVKMDVGEITSSVIVEAGAEVLQTQQTTVGSTVTGKLITTIPFTSRETLDLAVLDPGAQSTGAPRGTSFNGLPQGAINITLDGLNAQVNDAKSSDGFFTMIRARTDTIEEFNISTAAQGSEQASEGAVQIRFETKRGGNEFHGGAWWYHRNDFFNANYFFSNLNGVPRQRLRLNQYGYNVGGPIWKDKIFFFHAFDFYQKPESLLQGRTILTPLAAGGTFTYVPVNAAGAPTLPSAAQLTAAPWVTCNATAVTCSLNTLGMISALAPLTVNNVLDPTIQTYMNALLSVTGVSGVSVGTPPSPFTQALSYNSTAMGERWFPDFRFDYQITKGHLFTTTYHYGDFNSTPDLLNGRGPTYPVAPFDTYISSQLSTRNAITFAWRWNLRATMSNEARFGIQSAPSNFRGDQSAAFYPSFATALGPLQLRPSMGLVTQPFHDFSPFTRNYALGQFSDNFGWAKGRHNLNFGFNLTELRGGFENRDSAAGTVTIGMNSLDPTFNLFSTGNLPNISSTQQTNARALYGTLTGRVTGMSSTIYVNNDNRQFTPGASRIDRIRQTEFGFYGSDNWRMTNTLTFNYGVRWEYQGAGQDPDNLFYHVVGDFDGIWDVSGVGNLFTPGASSGTRPSYELNNGRSWYGKDMNNFAPSIGLAWQPSWENKLWKMMFGDPGKTVVRAGYALTYTREGANNWISIANSQPGSSGSITGTPNSAALVQAGQFAAGSIAFSSFAFGPTNVRQFPVTFGGTFQADPSLGHSVNAFRPDLQIPTVQSWSFGIQREITPNMVLEVRYVGNHGTGLWRQVSLNEVNIFENGFLNEFMIARDNLTLCQAGGTGTTNPCRIAQAAAGLATTTSSSIANWGLAGQRPLPIITGSLTGTLNTGLPTPGSCTNAALGAAGFTLASVQSQCNSGFTGNATAVANGLAGTFANTLNSLAGWTNLTGGITTAPLVNPATGQPFPLNFWMVAPHARGGSFIMNNDTHSTYNGLQIEFRRRQAKGLQFNGNYVFSKSLSNLFADSSVNGSNWSTLRDTRRDKGPSPWDIRNAFKLQLIYEFPFGPGRKWSTSNGVVNRFIEGWDFSSITRWQTGRVFQLNSGNGGTVNGADPGVDLVGINREQLQSMLEVRKVPGTPGQVFYFPASVIGANGAANTAFIRPCNTPGQFCQRLFLYGPQFFRADWSIIKKTRITEKTNIEFRAEFLNAFNNANFYFGGSAAVQVASVTATGTTFGRITSAYQDVSTTDDPGGRIIQMVLRFNF